MPHFVSISKCLTDFLKKHTQFVWTEEHTKAFEILKEALVFAPVIAVPDFSKPFVVTTDASATGIRAILSQQGHPLTFLSKALGSKNQGLSTYKKEYLAIIMAVAQWRSYLQLAEFTIFIDYKSLAQLNEQRLHTIWQQKVYSKLAALQHKIVYKKGSENNAADVLSRARHATINTMVVSQCTPAWVQEVVQGYHSDPQALELLTKLSVNAQAATNFTLKDGLLRFKGKVWIGNNSTLQQKIISAMHNTSIGGHSGIHVTYQKLKQLFAWPSMKTIVHEFVKSCLICQQAKPER